MKKLWFYLFGIVVLLGCDNQNSLKKTGTPAYTLQLLHYADIDGNEEVALSSIDEFSALINAFSSNPKYKDKTLVLSSGDNIIPGPRFYAAEQKSIQKLTGSNEPGHIDIAFMNYFGTKASAIGNHELDASPKEFLDAIKSKSKNGVEFSGAKFPYLSCNIDFTTDKNTKQYIGENSVEYSDVQGKLASSTIVNVNGESIGIVGASTPLLGTITDIGNMTMYPKNTNSTKELANKIQSDVDDLKSKKINKIILLAHMQQISIEKELANLLTDVDIIVAGGSNTRMGDSTDSLFPGDNKFDEDYPYITKTKDGKPIIVVNVDGDYKYLGRAILDFDQNGELLLGNMDKNQSGVWASTSENISKLNAKPMPKVVQLQNTLNKIIKLQFGNVLGYTNIYLDGRRSQVRTQETNLGNLTADANLWYARKLGKEHVDISFKNGGGIRTEIGQAIVPAGTNDPLKTIYSPPPENKEVGTLKGAITEGHLKAVLRFDNGLTTIDLTANELKTILEHSIASSGKGKTPGAFPQIAGMSFSFNLSNKVGSRVTSLEILNDDKSIKDTVVKNSKIQGNPNRKFRMVTINFLVNGGDDYPFNSLKAPNRRNLYAGKGYGETQEFDMENIEKDPGKNSSFSYTGGEQDAFAEYLIEFHSNKESAYSLSETPSTEDKRILEIK